MPIPMTFRFINQCIQVVGCSVVAFQFKEAWRRVRRVLEQRGRVALLGRSKAMCSTNSYLTSWAAPKQHKVNSLKLGVQSLCDFTPAARWWRLPVTLGCFFPVGSVICFIVFHPSDCWGKLKDCLHVSSVVVGFKIFQHFNIKFRLYWGKTNVFGWVWKYPENL